ncbi:unnamed protein product, partial [Symbiodinium microadriaticum]
MNMQIVIANSLAAVEPDIVHQMRLLRLLVLAAFAACAVPRHSNFVAWKSGRCHRSNKPLTGCRAAVSESEGLQLHASRAVLHLSIVPQPAPASTGIAGPGLPPGVQSLSLLGRTIGGSFAIEWDDSPWGAYMEAPQSCLHDQNRPRSR